MCSCLDLHNCDTFEGARVGVWQCLNKTNACNRDNDRWDFVPLATSSPRASAGTGTALGLAAGTVRNRVRGACLGVDNSSAALQVKAFTCRAGDASQLWQLPAKPAGANESWPLVQAPPSCRKGKEQRARASSQTGSIHGWLGLHQSACRSRV